ncbi:HNH endonuclease family protein, partial [Streptomyces sp. 15-116A]
MRACGQGVTYDHPLITVEHVLPQNPKAGSRWVELFDEDQRAQWTHR